MMLGCYNNNEDRHDVGLLLQLSNEDKQDVGLLLQLNNKDIHDVRLLLQLNKQKQNKKPRKCGFALLVQSKQPRYSRSRTLITVSRPAKIIIILHNAKTIQ